MKEKCNTLIWLGVGTGSSASISFEEFDRVITVEARPSITLASHIKNSYDSKIEMHKVCLIPQNTKFTKFNIYNVEEFNSLDEPTGIYDLYPNITKISDEDVEFEFVTTFLNGILFDDNTLVKLVIDIPDVSVSFVEGIIRSRVFSQVREILLFSSQIRLFRHGALLTELLALFENSVDIMFEINESDPDFPICDIEIDQLAICKKVVLQLQNQIKKITSEQKMLKKDYEDNRAFAESLEQQLKANEQQLIDEKSLRAKAEKALDEKDLQIEEQEVETERVLYAVEEKLLKMTLKYDQQKLNAEDNISRVEYLEQQLEVNEKQLIDEKSLRTKAECELDVKDLQIEEQKVETERVLNAVEEKLVIESSSRVKSDELSAQLGRQIKEIKSKLDKSEQELNSRSNKINEAEKRIEQMLTMQTMNMRLLQKSESDNTNLRETIVSKMSK
eukprot:TRINITY_DN1159_c0_g1_i2.p1 TRINITY_DN1159_c0_g1~~TRINITY_DN1159_c0_g1_i2.p1  ORF type:complete len:446 (+),score=67.55 TRINITY_DN1159_c0_g1_i2:563-1900(+)